MWFTATTAVILLLGVTVLDRVVVRVAGRVAAERVAARTQRAEGLPSRPVVSIGGFPFLTQVASGRYQTVAVDVRGYTKDGPRIAEIRAELQGVRLPLWSAVRGDVTGIPVDRLAARVLVTFDDLNAYLAGQRRVTRVRATGAGIQITGTVTVLGQIYNLSGAAEVGVTADAVTITPRGVGQGMSFLPAPVRDIAVGLLTVKVPVSGLPFNMRLRSAEVSPDGVIFLADGEQVVLDKTP